MTDRIDTIRSYQRIFSPERRVYSIEGHPIPVPGGVPLRWLAYASGALVAVLILAAQSVTVAILGGMAACLAGFAAGGGTGAATAGLGGFAGIEVAGWSLAGLDWPLRLIVLPAAVATLATQATPDGRLAHRFAYSWLRLRLSPRRRSLERPLSGRPEAQRAVAFGLWVGSDERLQVLPAGVVRGPALVEFARPVEARRLRRRRLRASQLGRRTRRGTIVRQLNIKAGEALEVRP